MSEKIRGLLDFVYRAENGGKVDYNVIYGGIAKSDYPPKPLTEMTVGEVWQWQESIDRKYNSEAAGAGQFMQDTIADLVKQGAVSKDDLFDEATQDRMTVALMRRRGLDDWQAGKLSTADFGTNLAMEWASLPVLKDTYRKGTQIRRGSAYYGGVGANKSRALTSAASLEAQLGEPGQKLFLSTRSYDPTGTPGSMMDPAGSRVEGQMDQRMRAQFEPGPDPYRHMGPWETPDVQLGGGLEGPAGGGGEPAIDGPPLPSTDYNTRTGAGGGPVLQGWGQAFRDSATDGYIARQAQHWNLARKYEWDRAFDPLGQAEQDGLLVHHQILGRARNRDHYDGLKRMIEAENLRRKRMQVWDGTAAHTLGAMLNPDTLISMAIPVGGMAGGAFRGALGNFSRAGAVTTLYSGAAEVALEAGRASLDPNSTELDSFTRVAGATILSGLIGGGVGVMAGARARRQLADELAADIARSKGVGKTTDTVDLGGGQKGRVFMDAEGNPLLREGGGNPVRWHSDSRGVKVVGEAVHVDPKTIQRRWATGAHDSPAESATELMEYEISRAAALVRRLKAFRKDERGTLFMDGSGRAGENPFAHIDEAGNVQIDRAAIQKAIDEGEPIVLGPARGSPQDGRIKPFVVKPGTFKTAEEAAAAIEQANTLAAKARDTGEFRRSLEGLFQKKADDLEPEVTVAQRQQAEREADFEAAEALETYRRENNRILQDAKMEALARLTDGPYKRIHRNALSPEARDLVDRLAADGGFLRGSDGTGLTVGPSVYSRAKTWAGVTRRLYDRETELYEKYLGFESNPNVADIAMNKSFRKHRADGQKAIPVEDFRARVTQAYITGEKDAIPEVMEMVETLRGAFDEYHGVASDYGVITTQDNLMARMERLRERLYDLDPESKQAAGIQAKLDDLMAQANIAKQEPGEDYFTRIWNRASIEKHREAFKERVVKPWMMQQNRVQIWKVGKNEIEAEIKELLKEGLPVDHPRLVELRRRYNAKGTPERSSYQWVEMSTEPAAIEKRADEMIDEILGEAEPEDLTTMREAHRPVFGRHRQFNIPNAMLLKGGGKGNGIADFIETDYMLVHQIYQERMGPAIEMARSFSRPVDGISARDGFEEALAEARNAEMHRWGEANKKRPGVLPAEFKDHWAPIERDLMHLKDRVTNRVIRDPNRWDNRTATALRNWSHLAFMGMSALPAVQEIGTLIMRHGMSRTFQHAFGQLDEGAVLARQMGVEEMRKAGAIMEVVNGAALSRFAETGMEATTGTAPERWLKHAANKYFMWNGLAPLSTRLKELDAGLRVHDTLERIMRVSDLGKGADKADLEELARWGLSRADAEAIAREPIEQIEGGHWVANTDMWGNEDLVRRFRAAINQGNENTILMATAADKPTIIDGTFYLRAGGRVDKYAARAGLRKVGDYWQVQSGLMTLPFTFWNYAIAAHNKILTAGLDEASAQKLGGMAAMVGMGYLVASVRTPDFKWDQMNAGEKMIAAIDQSGVMGVLSQFVGIAEQPTVIDAVMRAAGAGPSVAANAIGGAVSGDANQFSWALPFRNHFLLKGFFDRAVDAIERMGLDGAA